jgi:hypothetical protein
MAVKQAAGRAVGPANAVLPFAWRRCIAISRTVYNLKGKATVPVFDPQNENN